MKSLLMAELRQENEALKELAEERNMVSELIMDEPDLFIGCIFSMHDAHSFWDAVRKAHKELKRGVVKS